MLRVVIVIMTLVLVSCGGGETGTSGGNKENTAKTGNTGNSGTSGGVNNKSSNNQNFSFMPPVVNADIARPKVN